MKDDRQGQPYPTFELKWLKSALLSPAKSSNYRTCSAKAQKGARQRPQGAAPRPGARRTGPQWRQGAKGAPQGHHHGGTPKARLSIFFLFWLGLALVEHTSLNLS